MIEDRSSSSSSDICYFHHCARVSETGEAKPKAAREDTLVMILKHKKVRGRVVMGDGFDIESQILIADREIWVLFSHIKQFSSDTSIESEYTQFIAESLSRIGVPQAEHAAIIESVFLAVDAAVSPARPLDVTVWDMTILRSSTDTEWRPNFIPAAKSSIEQLSHTVDRDPPTMISSCAICLGDFAAAATTRLPCAHHYHLDCIARWLELSHLCPICRYPMPTEQQQQQQDKPAARSC